MHKQYILWPQCSPYVGTLGRSKKYTICVHGPLRNTGLRIRMGPISVTMMVAIGLQCRALRIRIGYGEGGGTLVVYVQ